MKRTYMLGVSGGLFVTALVMQGASALSQSICGDTLVEVGIQASTERRARDGATRYWSNCAQSSYGDAWGRVELAKNHEMECIAIGGRPYAYGYAEKRPVTCPTQGSGGYLCYFSARPCRRR
jgi:hypothetical protein